ncbi:ankyrin repeat protein, partial [Cooperia oncophora]
LKARAGKEFGSLRPSQPTQGPLRNAVVRLSERCDADSDAVVRELASLPHFSLDEPLSLPLPYELTEVSLTSVCPLAWCCALGKAQLVLILRAAGADVNATDLEGRTPLMVAVLANKEAAVEALCGDGSVVVKKPAALKKTKGHTATRLFLGAMQGRKRKAPEIDDDEDEEDERAETEEESDADSEGSESEAEVEDEAETEQDDTETTPPKKINISNKNLDLMICDRKGRNIVHYMVEPIPWENVELLKKLYKEAPAKIKQLLQQKNKDGNTPLDIAMKTKQRRMASAIKDILGGTAKKAKISNGVHISDLPDVSDLVCKYNVNEESKLFLARWNAEHNVAYISVIPKPSALSGYRDTAELVMCPVTQQYITAVLNKTDLNYGRYGFHNFYRNRADETT